MTYLINECRVVVGDVVNWGGETWKVECLLDGVARLTTLAGKTVGALASPDELEILLRSACYSKVFPGTEVIKDFMRPKETKLTKPLWGRNEEFAVHMKPQFDSICRGDMVITPEPVKPGLPYNNTMMIGRVEEIMTWQLAIRITRCKPRPIIQGNMYRRTLGEIRPFQRNLIGDLDCCDEEVPE